MKLIVLKQTLERFVSTSCGGNETLRQAERDGFENFLNQDLKPDKSALYLAIFTHKSLQKEKHASKHREALMQIKTASFATLVKLFKGLLSKDIFENFYTKFLAERLLKKKSESTDREQEFVSCIKSESGQQFFHKIEQMFNDISQS